MEFRFLDRSALSLCLAISLSSRIRSALRRCSVPTRFPIYRQRQRLSSGPKIKRCTTTNGPTLEKSIFMSVVIPFKELLACFQCETCEARLHAGPRTSLETLTRACNAV